MARGDWVVYFILAIYLTGTAILLVWQYRTARLEVEELADERCATERHSSTVRMARDLVGLFEGEIKAQNPASRQKHLAKLDAQITRELDFLQKSLPHLKDGAEQISLDEARDEAARPVTELLGKLLANPALAVTDPAVARSYEESLQKVFALQLECERMEAEVLERHREPAAWQQEVGMALGALLLLLAGAGSAFLYRYAIQQRQAAATRAALIEELRQTQNRYREMFDNATEGIFQATPDGKYYSANEALARLYGYNSPEHLVACLSEAGMQLYVQPSHRDRVLKRLEGDETFSSEEIEVVRADGRTLWVRETVRPIRDDRGGLLYYEGTVEDISDRWWSEQRRRVQQATSGILETAQSVAEARPMMLQAICDILGWAMGAVWDVEAEAGVLQCVEVWHTPEIDIAEFEATVTSLSLAPGQGLAGRVWAEGEPQWIANLKEDHDYRGAQIALKHGMGSVYGVPIKVQGMVRHVAEFFSPQICACDPELLQLFSVIGAQLGHLIERKTAEEALRKSEMRKAAILHSALDCIISFDGEGQIVEFNPAAEKAFGYRRWEALGTIISHLITPQEDEEEGEDGQARAGTLYDITNPPRAWGRRVEMLGLRKDGTRFPAEVAISRMRLDEKIMFTAFLRDISERKEAEWLTSQLAAVVQNSNDAIIGCTRDGFIRSWNIGAERIYGYTTEEAVGLPLHMLIPEERLDEFPQTLTAIRRGESLANYETVRLRKDGKKISVSLTDSPIRGEAGRITGLSSIARDITERKRLEEELLQSQKMEAVGRLAGGIAHDFNNILTAILGYSDLIIGQIEERHWMYKHLCEVRKAADFAASLTQQLLAFSRRQPLFLRVFSINDTVKGLQKMVQRVIGEQIVIKTELKSKVGRLKADPSQLEQVLLNLCVNSRDAMPGGGTIVIGSEDVTYAPKNGQDPHLHLLEMPAGEYVRLSVSDTGTGIPPEVMKHIFEPFFTTKEKGQGTGLGLATCYGIVKQSGGYISVESAVGEGTKFSVFLPRVEESGEKIPSRTGQGQLPGGNETILYVEDEAAVRSLTSHVLRRLGYTVLEAGSGEQARTIVQEQNGHPIDLLFADVVLPDLSGKQLADWVVERKSDTKLLFTSGYVDEGILLRHGISSEMAFLRKPFSPSDLAQKLREVMDAGAVATIPG